MEIPALAHAPEFVLRRSSDRARPVALEWAATGGQSLAKAVIATDAGGTVRVTARAQGRVLVDGAYPGSVIVLPSAEGRVTLVNQASIDQYLLGVVPREIGAGSPLEALKAQTVAARSYAIGRALSARGKAWDLTADTSSQAYGGVSGKLDGVRRAVGETHGLVLMADGGVVRATYHACCGGSTAEAADIWGGSLPGARAVYDGPGRASDLSDEQRVRALLLDASPSLFCAGTDMFRWRRRYTAQQIETALARRQSGGVGKLLDVRVSGRAASGHVRTLTFVGSKRTISVQGDPIRWALGGDGLPSTFFSLDRAGGGQPYTAYEFFGGGWGHGVGLCQSGAIGMARAGYDFRAILAHYYAGATVADLSGVETP